MMARRIDDVMWMWMMNAKTEEKTEDDGFVFCVLKDHSPYLFTKPNST